MASTLIAHSSLPAALQRRGGHFGGVPVRTPALAPRRRALSLADRPDREDGGVDASTVTAANRRSSSASGPPGPAPVPPPPTHGLVAVLPFDEEAYVEVGRVTGAHGVRGELRLEVSTDEPAKRFKAGRKLFLLPPAAQGLAARANPQALALMQVTARGSKVRPLGKGQEAWLVALDEVTGRTQAELLHGHLVFCAAADRDALRDPDEFYVTDIIGCTVIDQASRRMVGSVVDVFSGMGTHDTLRVKLRATEADIMNSRIRYAMIPFAKSICPVLDLGSRTLEVAPPEGLLDMATEQPLRKPLSDEAKTQKLQELREQLRKEAEARAQQPQAEGSAAAGTSTGAGSSSDDEEDGNEEAAGEEEDGEQGAEEKTTSARVRRPGLRRGAGSLRLGRRRVAKTGDA